MQNSQVSVDFAKLTLEAAYPELREINSGNGTTKGSLTCEDIRQFRIPIPKTSRQISILSQISNLHKANGLLQNSIKVIQLLEEKKVKIINKSTNVTQIPES